MIPEGGYQGDYVRELAAQLPEAGDRDVDELMPGAVELLLTRIKRTLDRYESASTSSASERCTTGRRASWRHRRPEGGAGQHSTILERLDWPL